VLTERAIARNQDALIPTLGHLAERFRSRLGEKQSAIEATRPVELAITPSFEAYRLYLQARQKHTAGESNEALAFYREALARDSDFAMAWRGMGSAFANLGQVDSSQAAFDQALRRPQRLSTAQRLLTEGDRAANSSDYRGALAAYD